jgi:hypothetical protein
LLTRRLLFLAGVLAGTVCVYAGSAQQAAPGLPNDLDAFMARVLQRRSENWRTLHDYVLNEKEHFEVLGPGRARLFGSDREFTWYLRDGILVRSPLRFDGVAIGDHDRKAYEDTWARQEQHRAERRERRMQEEVGDLTELARQGAEPRFISESYFMNFHFEPGNYYLAGRETLEGRQVLRIEYYPTHLFNSDDHRRTNGPETHERHPEDEEVERKLNKVALVTLWVDPQEQQIVKFTFQNMDFGFLPGRWLVRADELMASMVMSQPIKDIWLPREISGSGKVTLASGTYEISYAREFFDYRQGEVKTKIRTFTPQDR